MPDVAGKRKQIYNTTMATMENFTITTQQLMFRQLELLAGHITNISENKKTFENSASLTGDSKRNYHVVRVVAV